jgi:hypothetical protein
MTHVGTRENNDKIKKRVSQFTIRSAEDNDRQFTSFKREAPESVLLLGRSRITEKQIARNTLDSALH